MRLADVIASKHTKNTSPKEEVVIMKRELVKKEYELLLFKRRKFEINQRLVKIIEQMDAYLLIAL